MNIIMDNTGNVLDKINKVILSSVVIEGLLYLCNEMTMEMAKKLVENSVKLTLHSDYTSQMSELYSNLNHNIIKQSEYSVVTLYALATRYGLNNFELRCLLEEHKISQIMIEELIHVYDVHRDDFVLRQLHIGKYLPIITDVQWCILTDIKSSSALSNDGAGEVYFNVNLGEYDQKNGERITCADFICNTEEMQHLINKLKEVERHCNKIANE